MGKYARNNKVKADMVAFSSELLLCFSKGIMSKRMLRGQETVSLTKYGTKDRIIKYAVKILMKGIELFELLNLIIFKVGRILYKI